MSIGSSARDFRLRRSVMAMSLCLAVSFFASVQLAYAADTAEPAKSTTPTATEESVAPETASAETASAGAAATKDSPAVNELPNVDQVLGADSSSPTDPNGGLTGSVTTTTTVNETAMATPPKLPPAAVKPTPRLPPMTQVKVHYKQGKYLDGLKVLATIKPTELTHYYAGLCYQGQGQLQKAAAEFGYVASIAKDPLIRYNASSALQAVSSYARSRRYSGQGNAFARAPSGGGGGGGGGGTRRRSS